MTHSSQIQYRRAARTDFTSVSELLEPFVQQQQLLPRSESELHKLLECAYVAIDSEQIVGFCAVEIYSRKLAELQGLAVTDSQQRRGIGRRLVELCIELARKNNVHELMAITSSEELFRECGFDYALPDQKRALFMHPLPLGLPTQANGT